MKRIAVVATLLASVVIAASDPDTAARREFTQAYAAADKDTSSDSAALQSYVLYPYLQAARFKRALARGQGDVTALDQAIKAWLSAHGTAPVTTELRRAWLLALASRQQWAEFQAAMPFNTNDAELRCLHASAVLATAAAPEPMLSGSLVAIWLNANRLPAVCNAPFDWARSRQVISADLIERRARLALQAGNTELARDLAGWLPAARAQLVQQWAQLIERPQAALDALLAKPRSNVEPAALQDGWLRLARKDPDAAIARLPRLQRLLANQAVAVSPYVLNLALALAWNRRAEALMYFARVARTDMNEQAFEWQVRAALWAGDWARVEQGIRAMPEALRAQARWRYWLARAQQQGKDGQPAQALYQQLTDNDDNYYAALAAARLMQPYAPHPLPLADDGTANKLALLPGMRRAHELLLVRLRDAATAEWSLVFASLQPGEHLAAARLAHEWGWYEQAIATTAKLGLFNDYAFLYPRPYQPEVLDAAKRTGLPAEMIYAVMRQETLFRADAQSAANARGLLQLLPETARATARKFGLPAPDAEQLFDPAINVPLGAVYLKSLVDGFDGQPALALAAYNAGPVAARRWLPSQAMAMDVWIENIPYNETRNYVQRVLWHSLVFHWLLANQPVDTQAWLNPIKP